MVMVVVGCGFEVVAVISMVSKVVGWDGERLRLVKWVISV